MRAALSLLFLLSSPAAWGGEWQADMEKSSLTFSAIQIGDVIVKGRVKTFDLALCFDERDLAKTALSLTFPVKQLTTGVAERDEILMSGEWMNAEQFPGAGFNLKTLERLGPNSYQATGVLEIKGIQKDITFPLTLSLLEERASGALTIDRRDFIIGDGSWGENEKWVKFPIAISFDIFANPTGESCEQ